VSRLANTKLAQFTFLLILVALLFAFPYILRAYHLDLATLLLINLILVVSFHLISTAGLWSMAHVGLMAVGAYTAGLLVTRLDWNFWLVLPLGILGAAVIALLLGLPILRTRATQFFLASFAVGEGIRLVFANFQKPFGGQAGIGVVPRPTPIPLPGLSSIDFSGATSFYYLVLILALISLVILYRLERSRIGDTLRAIASNEELCKSMGINTYGYLILAFVVGSAFAGLAGILLTNYQGIASPSNFTFIYSLNILIFVLVGGKDGFAGPIVGAVVLTILGEVMRGLLEYVPLIYGVILIVTVLALPGGLTSLPARVWNYIKSSQRRDRGQEEET
jgi:branched-chain amino acid transport system permease protein